MILCPPRKDTLSGDNLRDGLLDVRDLPSELV